MKYLVIIGYDHNKSDVRKYIYNRSILANKDEINEAMFYIREAIRVDLKNDNKDISKYRFDRSFINYSELSDHLKEYKFIEPPEDYLHNDKNKGTLAPKNPKLDNANMQWRNWYQERKRREEKKGK